MKVFKSYQKKNLSPPIVSAKYQPIEVQSQRLRAYFQLFILSAYHAKSIKFAVLEQTLDRQTLDTPTLDSTNARQYQH